MERQMGEAIAEIKYPYSYADDVLALERVMDELTNLLPVATPASKDVSLLGVCVLGFDSGNVNTINHIQNSGKEEGSSLLLAIISKGVRKTETQQEKEVPSTTTTTTVPTETIVYEEAPCVLHSIRYGCICRYGDHNCENPNNCRASPTPDSDSEDIAIFSSIFPQIVQHLGDEPIEIEDIVKSIRVYDSDDSPPAEAEETTPAAAEEASELL
ncbi:hypothetical protein RN001_004138 [Aquatica leii]|uniref:Uncharacterized protein n=1 Tax=Aquatica leii TaxID=1421715 RepID=A0AAN7SL74_9COLE|nr:hypothetical protein RN001_004138 [Aquatica leii]